MAGQLPSDADASQGDDVATYSQVHVVESLGESSVSRNPCCGFDESDEGFEDGGLGDWGDLFGMDEDVAASSSLASTSTLVDDAFDDITDVSSVSLRHPSYPRKMFNIADDFFADRYFHLPHARLCVHPSRVCRWTTRL